MTDQKWVGQSMKFLWSHWIHGSIYYNFAYLRYSLCINIAEEPMAHLFDVLSAKRKIIN